MTVSAPVERPRILARLAEKPGTAYEVAAALGYSKPESQRIAEIIRRLHQAGALVAVPQFRPMMGRPANVYHLAPPGTPPQPRPAESPAAAEERRRRERIAQRDRRARRGGKPVTGETRIRASVRLAEPPQVWDLPGAPACAGADPGLFFGPEYESPEARVRRVKRARVLCNACPVRRPCADGARARGERWGIWAGIDLETQADLETLRAGAAASGRTAEARL